MRRLFFVVNFFLLLARVPALAQTAAVPAPDIVGLKLGITMAQAKQQLLQYDKNMKIITLYVVERQGVPTLSRPEPTIDFMQANGEDTSGLKVPVELIGIDLKQFWSDANGTSDVVVTDGNTKVDSFSGEFFHLSFIPNDNGGRLYAIQRRFAYDVGRINPLSPASPSGSELNAGFVKKYGMPSTSYEPSSTSEFQLIWLYDERGRLLPNSSQGYQQCAYDDTNGVFLNGIPPQYNFGTDQNWTINLINKALGMAASDFDGSTVAPNSVETQVADIFLGQGYVELTPDSFDEGNRTTAFRECGIQLETSTEGDGTSPGTQGATTVFTEILSDHNAAYYDNGWDGYVKEKLSAINQAAPKAAAPSL